MSTQNFTILLRRGEGKEHKKPSKPEVTSKGMLQTEKITEQSSSIAINIKVVKEYKPVVSISVSSQSR